MKQLSNKELKRSYYMLFITGTVLLLVSIVYTWCLVLAIIEFVLGLPYYKEFKKRQNEQAGKEIFTKQKQEQVDESQTDYDLFDIVVKDFGLKYQYEENILLVEGAINLITGNGGETIEFEQEPNNKYDSNAIVIKLKGEKIGYVYKGKIQDMISDWIKRGELVVGYINKIFVAENKATYKIAFYKPLEDFESIPASLTKTKKKIDEYTKREDNLMGCKENDFVYVEYDKYDYSYIVYNDCYEEIGELSQSVQDKLEEKGCEETFGTIKQIDYTDSGSLKAKINIYFK